MSDDPYCWPFPKRSDPFQTIKNSYKTREPTTSRHIEESNQQLKLNYTNKQDFINKVDDIPGARSQSNIRASKRADLQLVLDDIKGTRPNIVKFQTSRSPLNPLEPEYKLPSFVTAEPEKLKFIRDSHNVQDIQGAQPKQTHKKLIVKDSEKEEAYGTHQIPRFIPKNKIDQLYVKDINDYLLYKTTRIANPLEPTYDHVDFDGNKMSIGFIEGSKSKPLYPKEPKQSLLIKDIDGAQAGSLSSRLLRTHDRKDFRETNSLADIQGAKAGTLQRGLGSNRYTNPLNPQYQLPGSESVFQSNAKSQIGTQNGLIYNEHYKILIKMNEQKSLPRSRTFASGQHDELTTGQSQKTKYESCRGCCGNFWGTCRAWIPCCFCCPYPYYQINQGYIGLLQEFGRFNKTLQPGLHFVNQCSDEVVLVDMKTFNAQLSRSVILTKDNITSEIDTVLYYRIVDPIKCQYRLSDINGAMLEVTQSVMRTVCGEHTLQEMLVERIQISQVIEELVESIVCEWGVYVEKLFIKDQKLSDELRQGLALAGTTKKMTEAKIISAQADVDAAKFQRETSDILSGTAAMQIRFLEALQQIARGASKKVVMMGL